MFSFQKNLQQIGTCQVDLCKEADIDVCVYYDTVT